MREMLATLVDRLRGQLTEQFEARAFVDTGPLLERELAAAAGLGWFGRNTCLLNERFGSYLFLGELVTTLDLAPDTPVPSRCGTCMRCVEACPTKALVRPRLLDASRCIAYLTIEHRGQIPAEFHAALGDRILGCDACQQVCPYNARAPLATHPELVSEVIPARVDLLQLLSMGNGAYRRLTNNTAATRARRNIWRRNAAIVLGNLARADEKIRSTLKKVCFDADPVVRSAAEASAARLETSA